MALNKINKNMINGLSEDLTNLNQQITQIEEKLDLSLIDGGYFGDVADEVVDMGEF